MLLYVFVLWHLLNTAIVSLFLPSKGAGKGRSVMCPWRYLGDVWGGWSTPRPGRFSPRTIVSKYL